MNKNSILIYKEWHDLLKDIPDKILGIFFKAIFETKENRILLLNRIKTKQHLNTFGFILAKMDQNEFNYDQKCKINQENGRKGGRPKTERLFSVYKKNPNDKDKDKDNEKEVFTQIKYLLKKVEEFKAEITPWEESFLKEAMVVLENSNNLSETQNIKIFEILKKHELV